MTREPPADRPADPPADPPAGAAGVPRADPAVPSPARRGLEVAREALAAAKAEARRRGRGANPGAGGRGGDPANPTSGWRSRRAAADQRSSARPDERDPQSLTAALDRLLAERGWEADAAVGGAMGRWPAIVGSELAAHAEPLSFDRGELVVQADSTAWATQLRLLAPTLVRRLNEDLGAGTVVAVKVIGPGSPSWKRGRLSVRGRGPRDTYG